MQPAKAKSVEALIDAAVQGELGEQELRLLCTQAPELIALTLLAAGKRIAEQNTRIAELQGQSGGASSSPSTPSGMVPIYEKPNTKGRRKKPGAQDGHSGQRREKPKTITRHRTHRLKRCPHCDGRLQRCDRTRTRTTEDIPETVEPEVTEHTIHRDYCPKCKKHVEPVVPDAMPGATLGHHVIALTAWLHYGLNVQLTALRLLAEE